MNEPIATPAPPVDENYRCLHCQYNLTGLHGDFCPECGRRIDWEKVRDIAARPPRIAFECARGWWRLVGFVRTWATVLFAPWVFARQINRRFSLAAAVVFGGVCMLGTVASLAFGADWNFIVVWILTACIYIVLQTLLLALIDPQRPVGWHTSRFWLAVGGYTSAVMMTEFALGPPLVTLTDVLRLLVGKSPTFLSDLFEADWRPLVLWPQMILWLAGVGSCYFLRFRPPRTGRLLPVACTFVVAVVLFMLYAAAIEFVAANLYSWLSDLF